MCILISLGVGRSLILRIRKCRVYMPKECVFVTFTYITPLKWPEIYVDLSYIHCICCCRYRHPWASWVPLSMFNHNSACTRCSATLSVCPGPASGVWIIDPSISGRGKFGAYPPSDKAGSSPSCQGQRFRVVPTLWLLNWTLDLLWPWWL